MSSSYDGHFDDCYISTKDIVGTVDQISTKTSPPVGCEQVGSGHEYYLIELFVANHIHFCQTASQKSLVHYDTLRFIPIVIQVPQRNIIIHNEDIKRSISCGGMVGII